MKKQVSTVKDLIELLFQEGSLPDDRIRNIRIKKALKRFQASSPIEIDVYTEGKIYTYQGTLKVSHEQKKAVLRIIDEGKTVIITFPLSSVP